MSKAPAAEIGIEFAGRDMFVRFNGKRIAKRGHRKLPLLPGYRVTSPPDHSTISVNVMPSINERRGRRRRR
jgi:hypothetical protein